MPRVTADDEVERRTSMAFEVIFDDARRRERVTIEEDDDVAGRVRGAGVRRSRPACGGFVTHRDDVHLACGARNDLRRVVGRAVVDDDNLRRNGLHRKRREREP